MKKSALFRIILWACVLVVVIAAAVIAFTGGFSNRVNIGECGISGSYHYSDSSKYLIGDFRAASDDIKKIDIEWISGSVNISTYDGDEIIVSEDSGLDEDDQLRYRINDGKITIKFRKSGSLLGLFHKYKSKQLSISLPKSMVLDKLEVELVSSKLEADALSVNDIRIDGVSGKIKFDNVSADEISIEGVSGSVDVSGKADNLDIEVVSGSVEVEGDFRKLNVGTVSGSINADGVFDEIELETVSGSKTLKVDSTPKRIQVEAVSGHTDISLPKDVGMTVKTSAVSGSVRHNGEKLAKNSTTKIGDGSVKIDIETVSGSVEIEN